MPATVSSSMHLATLSWSIPTRSCMVRFDFALQQYTYTYKDYNKNLKPGLKKLLLPLCYVIKPFSRWMTMPKLQIGHIVAVTRFLSHVLQKNDGKVQFFKVEVDQVNILGKRSVLVGPNQFADTVKSILFFL